jgi:hypothetical protein
MYANNKETGPLERFNNSRTRDLGAIDPERGKP